MSLSTIFIVVVVIVHYEEKVPFLTGDRTSAVGLTHFFGSIARVVDRNISAH